MTVFTSMFAQLTGFTMLLSLQNSFASLHTTLFKTHVMSKSGDNIGLVWSKIYMSKKCQFEDVTIIPLYYCITCTRSSLSCLLAFYGIPIFQTFLIRRMFYSLVIIIAILEVQVTARWPPTRRLKGQGIYIYVFTVSYAVDKAGVKTKT